MDYKMQLTPEQVDILNGKQGKTKAMVMETLVMFGDIFGAKRLVEVTHKEGHLVTSFGIGLLKPLYKTMDRLIADGIKTQGTFTVDPRPLDRANVKYSLLDRLVNEKVMYSQQKRYEEQLKAVGLKTQTHSLARAISTKSATFRRKATFFLGRNPVQSFMQTPFSAHVATATAVCSIFSVLSSATSPNSAFSPTKAEKQLGLSRSKRQKSPKRKFSAAQSA